MKPSTLFRTADELTERTLSTTGDETLDTLLGGGLELGMCHLFYGDRILNDDLLRMAVAAQLPRSRNGLGSPSIFIDSSNMMRIDKLAEFALQLDLFPEVVNDHIFISRAFNASQTHDLVVNQLEGFFETVPAQLLLLPGLADIYIKEGLTAEGMQQITHMAHLLMTFSLRKDIATVITTGSSPRNSRYAAGGRALASCCQIHVHVEQTPMRVVYTLVKHPMYPVRREARMKRKPSTTLPLEYFVDEWVDDTQEGIQQLGEEQPRPPANDELTLFDFFESVIDE